MTRGFVILVLMGRAALPAAGSSAPQAAVAPSTTMSIEDLSFVPSQLSVSIGTKVVFVNHDHLPHSIVGMVDEKEKFRSDGQLDEDESFAVVLDEPGLVEVSCGIHSRMRARIIVTR
ncbi:MAG: plastocyanin/azurin family copper-binding protein [Methylocystis sp.]